MSAGIEKGTPVINTILTGDSAVLPPFATSNPDKLREISHALGVPLEDLQYVRIDVDEIQSTDPLVVARNKAKDAYDAAGGKPVIVEDTSLRIHALEEILPPTYVKTWGGTRSNREFVTHMLHEQPDKGATAQTVLAIHDGHDVQIRTGTVHGIIADSPKGASNFGWDDIFIPEGQEATEDDHPRTFAQMSLEEKQQYSMRLEALQKLKKDPFALGIMIHALGGSLQMELDAINVEYFKGTEMAIARKHAFNLRSLQGIPENENLSIEAEDLPPFHEVKMHPDITQYTLDPHSPDIGVIITGYDTRKTMNGQPTRLMTNGDNRPTFMQHGPDSYKRALAARAHEYALHHNPEMYAQLREMMQGKKTADRPNKPSPVIESLLGKIRLRETILADEESVQFEEATTVPGFTDLAYVRQYSDAKTSRTAASMNHILNRNGIPTSIFALGGMPPVTGSRDVVTTAALSFMRSYIPHNSLFVDFDRRKKMFTECKAYVEEMIPGEENGDIRELAVAQIGICISGNNMELIEAQTQEAIEVGCGSLRIYTTNPGPEVVEAAATIGKTWQQRKDDNKNLPFHLCVGPIVDTVQAKKLREVAEKYGIALTLLGGHGGGENCTSLEGGAAANAIEIIYELSKDAKFNNVSLGFEGGLGTWFGPWLGRIEQISKDGSMVRGCVETQGGLTVLHKSGAPVQPYSGTASPWTQMVEKTLFPGLANRTNPAGQLKNNEGKPGYMKAAHWATSIAHHMYAMRSMFGRTLADQRASNIDEMIHNIDREGDQHRKASATAVATAKSHRPEM